MPTIEQTLERLAITFVVRDIIMIPSESLVCAANKPEAAKASDGHPDFNVIPIAHFSGATLIHNQAHSL